MATGRSIKRINKNIEKRKEIAGIILIGFAIFLGVTIYLNVDSLFGSFIAGAAFGICGLLGYISPILSAGVGVLFIASRRKTSNVKNLVIFCLAIWFVFALIDIACAKTFYIDRMSFGDFLARNYAVSSNARMGGGVIGGFLAYWTYYFLGEAGSYIVFIVGIIACILVLTNLSLRAMGSGIGHAVQNSYGDYLARRQTKREKGSQGLYIETLDKEKSSKRSKKRKNKMYVGELDEFNIRVQNSENRMNELLFNESNFPDPFENYSPEPYRKVFAHSGITFSDEEFVLKPSRRKIEETPFEAEEVQEISAIKEIEEESEGYDEPKIVQMPKPRNIEESRPSDGNGAAEIIEAERVIELPAYEPPPLSLLNPPKKTENDSAADIKAKIKIIEKTFNDFHVDVQVTGVTRGPAITRYEVEPAPGVKVNRIVNLSSDLALNLAEAGLRIAPVPGKTVVGIEVPNAKASTVGLRELLADPKYQNMKSPLAFALGKDIGGENIYPDIGKMPHLLIAGKTGSGKSVCINSLIVSLLYHSSPQKVRMIMIDPKKVELSGYNGIPHLLVPVVTDREKAPDALRWAVKEMNDRYEKIQKKGARELESYNGILISEGEEPLPRIVVIVDELAELMQTASIKKDVETYICSIAQLGRASGIHLVLATQRPSADVFTGLIKSNVPARIAFAVDSHLNSRIILDTGGAETLLGHGDMLFLSPGAPRPIRLQGCFLSDEEIRNVTDFLRNETQVQYDTQIIEEFEGGFEDAGDESENTRDMDDKFMEALEVIIEYGQASASFLQRKLGIGNPRAARLMDQLEEYGYVSHPERNKREILITKEEYLKMIEERKKEG